MLLKCTLYYQSAPVCTITVYTAASHTSEIWMYIVDHPHSVRNCSALCIARAHTMFKYALLVHVVHILSAWWVNHVRPQCIIAREKCCWRQLSILVCLWPISPLMRANTRPCTLCWGWYDIFIHNRKWAVTVDHIKILVLNIAREWINCYYMALRLVCTNIIISLPALVQINCN